MSFKKSTVSARLHILIFVRGVVSNLLSQEEADKLLLVDKFCIDDRKHIYPGLGESLKILLKSDGTFGDFTLDITRGRIALKKNTFQLRTQGTIILARIDIGGPPHRNPDDEEIPCPHLHLYREGYDDKWAKAIPQGFSESERPHHMLEGFMKLCNIKKKPHIQMDLFA